jgi:hypothetical protein
MGVNNLDSLTPTVAVTSTPPKKGEKGIGKMTLLKGKNREKNLPKEGQRILGHRPLEDSLDPTDATIDDTARQPLIDHV